VVGAGAIGEGKAQSLLEAGALVCVVAPRATQRLQELAATGAINWLRRKFTPADLNGKSLVIAATSSASVNELVFRESQKRHVLCNAVDDPPHCDFFYGAVVRRGDLQIAISTNGKSPALAQRLRELLEQQFGPEFAEKVDDLGAAREKLFRSRLEPSLRKQLLHRMALQQITVATRRSGPSTHPALGSNVAPRPSARHRHAATNLSGNSTPQHTKANFSASSKSTRLRRGSLSLAEAK
jgi:siroheme synthase-like protein